MSDDPKTDWYLANRATIEEWAALRQPAAAALDQALLDGFAALADDEHLPAPHITEKRERYVKTPLTRSPLPKVGLEVYWDTTKLLGHTAGWPTLIIAMDPKHPAPLRDAVKAATASARDAHGLTTVSGWWLRSGPITPLSEPVVIQDYAQYCVQRYRDAWLDLHDTITSTLETATRSA